MEKLVYIVILNYKNWSDARDCIASILKSDHTNFRIILLDNASGDGSIEKLQSWLAAATSYTLSTDPDADSYSVYSETAFSSKPIAKLAKINLVQNDKNEGFAAGNNVALKRLANEDAYIWLLNPDMLVAPDALSELVRFTALQNNNCLTGAVLKKFDKPDEVYLYGGGKINWKTATVSFVVNRDNLPGLDYLNGSCIFFEAKHLAILGLLPTGYFLYWEETEWCYRAKLMGYEIRVCETAFCYDKISATIGKSYLSDFYYTRNGLLFLKKFSPVNVKIASVITIARIAKRILRGETNRAKGMIAGLKEFYKMQRNEN